MITPLRSKIKGKHPGVSANIIVMDWAESYWGDKTKHFKELTGCDVGVSLMTHSQWVSSVKDDLLGPGFFDGYIFDASVLDGVLLVVLQTFNP